jgi:hypothetical protein
MGTRGVWSDGLMRRLGSSGHASLKLNLLLPWQLEDSAGLIHHQGVEQHKLTTDIRTGGMDRVLLCPNLTKLAVRPNQCDLAPENLTTLRHFSVSSSMNVAAPAGELASTLAPKPASLAVILGSARAALISLFSA